MATATPKRAKVAPIAHDACLETLVGPPDAMPHIDAPSVTMAQHVDLPIGQISPSPYNPRTHFDDAALRQLADSILRHGLLQPIVVRPLVAGVAWEIVAGERRYRAAQIAGLQVLPARVLQLSDRAALELTIVENLQRADLDPIEQAEGFRALAEQGGMKQAAIAAAVKCTQPTIAKALGLLKLPLDVQELIREGKLSQSHGNVLLGYKEFPAVCSALAAMAAARHAPVTALEHVDHNTWYGLQRQGLVQQINHTISFDYKTVCGTCPFGAMRKVDTYSQFCLRPAHFEELRTEGEAARQAAIAAARATVGTGEVDLTATFHQAYEAIREPYSPAPEGCTEACPCRAVGRQHNGDKGVICTNPDRFRGLQLAQRERQQAARKALGTQRMTALQERLQELSPETYRQVLALAAHAALRQCSAEPGRQVLSTWAPELKLPKDKRSPGYATLVTYDVAKLARLIGAAYVADDVYRATEWGQDAPEADWFFAEGQADAS